MKMLSICRSGAWRAYTMWGEAERVGGSCNGPLQGPVDAADLTASNARRGSLAVVLRGLFLMTRDKTSSFFSFTAESVCS
jgi:hypothetical protein